MSSPLVEDWTQHFTPGRFTLLLILLLFVQYPEVILGTHSFFDRDYGLFTYPVINHARESLLHGEVPLWNPYINCGVPFLAQWNTSVCYPLTWLCVVFPLPWSLSYFCLGHLVLAGLGMYWLAHRWTQNRFAACVAGLAYALNGMTFNSLMWTSNLAALSWLPWVVLCTERAWREGQRRVLVAGLVGALQMLAGAPEIVLMTWLLLGTLWLGQLWRGACPWRRSGLRLALVLGLICGLAAIQLLPFFELLHLSDRQAGPESSHWSMPAWGWASFLVPLFRCNPAMLGTYIQVDQQWTSSYYLGIAACALALVAAVKVRQRRVWWLAGAALFGMVLALGENAFLYRAITRVIPQFALARYPIKFLVPTVFAVPLLAAYAAAWSQAGSPEKPTPARRSLAWCGAFLLVAIAGILVFSRYRPGPNESWTVTCRNGLERGLFLILTLGAIVSLGRVKRPTRRTALGWAVLLLLGLDALTHTPRQNPTVTNRAYGPIPLELSTLPRLGQSRAMLSPRMEALLTITSTRDPLEYYLGMRRALFMNCNMLDHVPKLTGFCSLQLRDEAAVRPLLYNPTNFPAGLADFLGASQISSPDVLFRWSPRESFLPWATGGQQPIFADRPSTLQGLNANEFDPRKVVYLPLELRPLVTATNAARVQIVSSEFSAQRADLTVEAEHPALVVVAQAFYPAWRAYVDEKPVPLWKANAAFQALEVPAGRHAVRLAYEDRAFYWGAALTGATLLACLLLALRRPVKALAN